jgi:hypothetical protein
MYVRNTNNAPMAVANAILSKISFKVWVFIVFDFRVSRTKFVLDSDTKMQGFFGVMKPRNRNGLRSLNLCERVGKALENRFRCG